MLRNTSVAASVLCAAALAVTGCGGGGPKTSGGTTLSDAKIVLGVLNDQSGVYSDLSGKNSVEAVKMAIEDFKAEYGDKAVTKNIEVITADPERSSVFVTEWRHLSPDRRDAIGRRRDAYEARVRDLIAEGQAIGAFAAIDPTLAATFLLTALNGIATWYRPDGRLSADRIADHYVDLALRSLSEDHR